VLFLPLILFLFFFVHYYKVVHFGISLPSDEEEVGQDTANKVPADRRVYFLPDVMVDELMLGALAILAMVVYAVFMYNAPLEHHANPLVTPFHTTAPWYFLWIQGLLKLGDKTLMGVVLPGVVFGGLAILPYVDFNPSRRASDRKVILSAGVVFALLMVILSYMGTPYYGVAGVPAQEVIQEFIPVEGVGPIRALMYEELPVGQYDTADKASYPKEGEFAKVFDEINTEIAKLPTGLPNGHGVIVIEDWQDGLKKVTMRILWDNATSGQTDTFEKIIYVHRDSIYHE